MITLPKWPDLHAHLRQGEVQRPIIADHLSAGCGSILAMPNTQPPVAKVLRSDPLPYLSIQEYQQQIRANGGDQFEEIIIPLYLSKDTTAEMITAGAKADVLKACKYYPPHGTTGAELAADLARFMTNGVFKAMQAHELILCVHGETSESAPAQYFDRETNAEEDFYRQSMPKLRAQFPHLKIVCEHITTKVAVDFVKAQDARTTAATVTPQHLLYTVGDLIKGLKYHLYCLPVVKFSADRASLRAAVTNPGNQHFFAGTDSAPHTAKATACGCAAGCYTAPVGPQLYAEAFEAAGLDLLLAINREIFRKFLCELGSQFYNLPISKKTFILEKSPQELKRTQTPQGSLTPLPLGLSDKESVMMSWRVKL